MSKNQFKLMIIAAFVLPLFALVAISRNAVQPVAAAVADDDYAKTTYEAKCKACHSPTALKFYDPAKPVEEQVEVILKGKKAEKPPNMPAFETKDINADQAKLLADYMKALRAAPATE